MQEPAQDDAQNDTQDDTEDDAEDDALDEDVDLDQDLHKFDDPNVQRQLNLLNTVIEDMYQSQSTQAQSRNPQVLPHLPPHS